MTSSKHTRRTVVGGMAATAAFGTLSRARAQAGPIRVGVLATLTGPGAELGKASALGTKIAADMINKAGGINGQQVELITRDTKFNANETVAIVRELSGDGVNFFVGDYPSHTSMAASPLMPSLNSILITPTSIAMELTHELYNRNFFRCGPNAYTQYNAQTALMAKNNPDVLRWGGIQPDNAGFKASWDWLTATLKTNYPKFAKKQVTIAEPVIFKSPATDFRTQINQLVAQNLEGFLLIPSGGEAVSFLQQALPFGLMQSVKAVADNAMSVNAGNILKKNVPKNFWTPCIWQLEGFKDVKMAQDFQKACVAETGSQLVNPFTANAYNCITSYAAGISAAKSTKTDAVIDALENTTFDSIFGPIGYRKEDHQLKVGMGFLQFNPQEAEPGWKIDQYVRISWEDSFEPPTPGKKFSI